MTNVIRFPSRGREPVVREKPLPKPQRWTMPRHYKIWPPNPNALGNFDVTGDQEWDKRQEVASVVLKVLLDHHKVSTGPSTHGLYRYSVEPEDCPQYLTDRATNKILNQFITFTRKGRRCGTPYWMAEQLRFASHDLPRGSTC